MKLHQPCIWVFNYGIMTPLSKELQLDMLNRNLRAIELPGTNGKLHLTVDKNYYVGGYDSITLKIEAKFRGFADAVLLADQVENLTSVLKVDDILSMSCLNALENPERFQSTHDQTQVQLEEGAELEVEKP